MSLFISVNMLPIYIYILVGTYYSWLIGFKRYLRVSPLLASHAELIRHILHFNFKEADNSTLVSRNIFIFVGKKYIS